MKYIRVEGPIAFVELSRDQTAIIDAADVGLVSDFSWHAIPSSTAGSFYARSNHGVYMHRLITACPKRKEVDHVNHNTLDNRRANLRVGSHKKNMQNGKFALATHCPKGHPYNEQNTYRDNKGRRCRKCNAERVAATYAAETPEQREERRRKVNAYRIANMERLLKTKREYALAHRAEKSDYDRRRRERMRIT